MPFHLRNDCSTMRQVAFVTGNPHKELVAELLNVGVQMEERGGSMKNQRWGNEDLPPPVWM